MNVLHCEMIEVYVVFVCNAQAIVIKIVLSKLLVSENLKTKSFFIDNATEVGIHNSCMLSHFQFCLCKKYGLKRSIASGCLTFFFPLYFLFCDRRVEIMLGTWKWKYGTI